jgi:hypothetical protein
MENSSKGLCYRLFKDNSEIESFLDNLTYKNRITYVNIDLVIIDSLPKQEDGMVLIMGIDRVIYARTQR